MPNRKRPKRTTSKKFTVYCEGKTESRYLKGLRNWMATDHPEISLRLETVDIGGGGYREFIKRLRAEADSNCLARFVLLDYDRAKCHTGERTAFDELLGLSRESKGKRVPLILIVSNDSFEYPLCCHDPEYRQGDPMAHLVHGWGYRDASDIKSDEQVWGRAHEGNRDHKVAMECLSTRPVLVDYELQVPQAHWDVRIKSVAFNPDAASSKTSNLPDLFKAIKVA